jgi:hypothetical protein
MNIDLNIQNYSNRDLEQLFQLQPNYSTTDIMYHENELYVNLIKTNVDVTVKENIILFLKQARDRLTPDPYVLSKQPLVKKECIKTITIDTTLRSQYASTKAYNYLHQLHESIKHVISIKINSIELPVHWNKFYKSKLILNNDIISIPDGNYTAKEFMVMFNDMSDIEVYIKDKTMFVSNEPFTLNIGQDIPLYKTAGWYMGFRQEIYNSTFNPIESRHEIISECPYGYSHDHVFIDIDDFHEQFTTNRSYSLVNKDISTFYLGKNIMGRIPVQNQTTIYIQDGFSIRTYQEPILLERLRIRILNKYGELLHLTTDYAISLDITTFEL